MGEVPVLEYEHLSFEELKEFELDSALGYAHTCYEEDLDRDLLRIIINTTHARRRPGVILAKLAAYVIRQAAPPPENPTTEQTEEYEHRYRAFKGAVMKAMSIRRVWQMKNDARRKAQGLPPRPKRPKQTEHPEDARPSHKGQLRLFS